MNDLPPFLTMRPGEGASAMRSGPQSGGRSDGERLPPAGFATALERAEPRLPGKAVRHSLPVDLQGPEQPSDTDQVTAPHLAKGLAARLDEMPLGLFGATNPEIETDTRTAEQTDTYHEFPPLPASPAQVPGHALAPTIHQLERPIPELEDSAATSPAEPAAEEPPPQQAGVAARAVTPATQGHPPASAQAAGAPPLPPPFDARPAVHAARRSDVASPSSSRASGAQAPLARLEHTPPVGAGQSLIERPVQPTRAGVSVADSLDQPTDNLLQRVTIISGRSAPLPAAVVATALPASPALQLVAAVAEDPAARAEMLGKLAATPEAAARASPLHSLTVQLQPASLGRLVARFTLVEGQLSVVVNVETQEAQSRLARDADLVSQALRAAGYEVDRIVVQHTPASTSAGQPATPERGGASLQQGSEGEPRRQSGHSPDQELPGQGARHEKADPGERGSGLYI